MDVSHIIFIRIYVLFFHNNFDIKLCFASNYYVVCLSVCLCIYLSARLSAGLSVCLVVCPSVYLSFCESKNLQQSVWMLLSAISQKHVFGHKFWTKAHTMMILVSRTTFWGSRNPMAALVLIVGLSVCLSVCLAGYLSVHLSQSVQSLSVFSRSVCLSFLWPVQLSAWSSSRSIYLQSLVTVAV